MSQETAFIGANTVLGKIWTKKRYFDYLISEDNFHLIAGKHLHMTVIVDPALELGPLAAQEQVEVDTKNCELVHRQIMEIKSEITIFVTTCDLLDDCADENSELITESDSVYIQNRLQLHTDINRQFGRVINVYIPELALPSPSHSPLLHCCVQPPKGKGKLPFSPLAQYQFYLPERIIGDVEKCIPIGISHLIPAMPPLTAEDVIKALAPELVGRLAQLTEEEKVTAKPSGSRRSSIHSFHWLDPRDGYLVSLDDQIELLKFYFSPSDIA